MIEIHWLWIPLIIMIATWIIVGIIHLINEDAGYVFSFAAMYITILTIIFYIGAALYWLFTHIKIVT